MREPWLRPGLSFFAADSPRTTCALVILRLKNGSGRDDAGVYPVRPSVHLHFAELLERRISLPATGPAIRAIFWDVGGVLLTNAWDHKERAQALEHFHLGHDAFEERHEKIVQAF